MTDGLHQAILWENIDGEHPRPPVLAILPKIIERENFDALLRSLASNLSIFPHKNCAIIIIRYAVNFECVVSCDYRS